jgi:hypothetical protein
VNVEQAYAVALEELTKGNVDPGCWAKAIAFSNGDETTAKAKYLQFRGEVIEREWRAQDEHSKALQARKNGLLQKAKDLKETQGYLMIAFCALVGGILWRYASVGLDKILNFADPLAIIIVAGATVVLWVNDSTEKASATAKAELEKVDKEMGGNESPRSPDKGDPPTK